MSDHLGSTLDELFSSWGTTREEAREESRSYAALRWEEDRMAYNATPHDFYRSWYYLVGHPIFDDGDLGSLFESYLSIHVAKVDPETRAVSEDKSLNTHVELWLEHGPLWRKDDAPEGFWTKDLDAYNPLGYVHTHDPDLDTGGDTFEQAIVALAHLVREEFGDDRSQVYVSDRDKHPERDLGEDEDA